MLHRASVTDSRAVLFEWPSTGLGRSGADGEKASTGVDKREQPLSRHVHRVENKGFVAIFTFNDANWV